MSASTRWVLGTALMGLGCGTPSTVYVRDGGGAETSSADVAVDVARLDAGAIDVVDGSVTDVIVSDVLSDASTDRSGEADILDVAQTDQGMPADVMVRPDGSVADAMGCAAGTHLCSGSCVSDTSVSSCGVSCTPCAAPTGGSATCASGACGTSCPTGTTLCSGACVSVASDASNCGTCGTVCPSGQSCSSGVCGTVCLSGTSLCGGSCMALGGACTSTGSGGCATSGTVICTSGSAGCSATPRTSGACTSPVNGACNSSGICGCAAGTHLCSGSCVSDTSVNSCGVSCTPCAAPTGGSATCVGGACGASCPTGATLCSGACVSVASDASNCGTCGRACSTSANGTATCAAGVCGSVCNPGFANCDANPANGCETDITSSSTNCGTCGNACAAGERCVATTCRVVSNTPNIVILGHRTGTNPKVFARSTTDASPASWTTGAVGPTSDTSTFTGRFRALNGRYWIGTTNQQLFSSLDGSTWSLVTTLAHPYFDIGFDPLLGYLIVSNTMAVSTSADGAAWVQHAAPMPGAVVGVAGGQWLIASAGRMTVARSADGISWTEQPIPTSGISENKINLVRCMGSPYLYLFRSRERTAPSSIVRTIDGVNWPSVMQTAPYFNPFEDVSTQCLNGIFSGIGINEPYAPSQNFSSDGVSWTRYQIYSGYNTSRPFSASSQTWDAAARVYIAIQKRNGAEWSVGARNSYFRATTVGGDWSLQTISSLPFSVSLPGGMYEVASLNEQ